jgi:hypothetical protein
MKWFVTCGAAVYAGTADGRPVWSSDRGQAAELDWAAATAVCKGFGGKMWPTGLKGLDGLIGLIPATGKTA